MSNKPRPGESREQFLERLAEYKRHFNERHPGYTAAYNAAYFAQNTEEIRERTRQWYHNNAAARRVHEQNVRDVQPEKLAATNAIQTAIERGLLVPTECSECHRSTPPAVDGRRTIQAHHYLGYVKEYWLDVIWLCISCHRKADNDPSSEV